MTHGIGCRVTANIVQCFACEWMTALMSSHLRRHERWSAFSVVGPSPFGESSTSPSGLTTTRSPSVMMSYGCDDGVMTTLPSGRRAERLPDVPSTSSRASSSFAVARSISFVSSALSFTTIRK